MDRLNTFIDRNTPAMLGRLKRLVGFATVNPPGADYEAITGYLTRELAKVGLSSRRFPIPGKLLRKSLPVEQHGYPRYNVLGRLKVPGARKTVHFNAHYDVVPVSGTWRHGNPFSGAVEKGLIYGRGTADMKGSMASLLTALDALRQTRSKPLMNVEVSFTADEETDSFSGRGGSSMRLRSTRTMPSSWKARKATRCAAATTGPFGSRSTSMASRPTARGLRTASTPSRRWRRWFWSSAPIKSRSPARPS